MNPDYPTWYRHIPTMGPVVPVRRVRDRRKIWFWTLTIVFAISLGFVFPLGYLFVLPFMIGFLSKVKAPQHDDTRNDPRHPYDNV